MIDRVKKFFSKLKKVAITGKQKAVGAFVVTTVTTYMGEHGLTLHDLWNWKTVYALGAGVISHAVVYWLTNTGSAG